MTRIRRIPWLRLAEPLPRAHYSYVNGSVCVSLVTQNTGNKGTAFFGLHWLEKAAEGGRTPPDGTVRRKMGHLAFLCSSYVPAAAGSSFLRGVAQSSAFIRGSTTRNSGVLDLTSELRIPSDTSSSGIGD